MSEVLGSGQAHLLLLIRDRVGNEVDAWASVKEGHTPGQSCNDQDGPVTGTEEDELALWLTCGSWPDKGMLLAKDETTYFKSTPQREKKRTKEKW